MRKFQQAVCKVSMAFHFRLSPIGCYQAYCRWKERGNLKSNTRKPNGRWSINSIPWHQHQNQRGTKRESVREGCPPWFTVTKTIVAKERELLQVTSLADVRAEAGDPGLGQSAQGYFPFSVALQSVKFGVYGQAMVLRPLKTKILWSTV